MGLKRLVEFLSSEKFLPVTEGFRKKLGRAALVGPCVYYAASYEALREIIRSGVVLPLNASEKVSMTDLSSTGVQSRRNEIYLGDGTKTHPPKPTHHCLNFFLNPFNTTIDAMCRNQLVLNGRPQAIGVIEFPLGKISDYLATRNGLWAFTRRNIAAGGRTSSICKELEQTYPWEGIFDVSDMGISSPERSAEFLLWIHGRDDDISEGLPIQIASRLLVSPNSRFSTDFQLKIDGFTGFREESKLLNAELYMGKFFRYALLTPLHALSNFENAVSLMPFELAKTVFANPDLSHSDLHGIPHITRVMFWTHFLSRPNALKLLLPDSCSDADLAGDSMVAALIHDLCRFGNHENTDHGEKAATKFSNNVGSYCNGDKQRTQRILEAVTWHCRPDDDCPNTANPVFKILKDADALDRGRFGRACGGVDFFGTECNDTRCKHVGCAFKTLRLNYENVFGKPGWPFRKNIALAARNIARSTRNAPWPNNQSGTFLAKWLNNAVMIFQH